MDSSESETTHGGTYASYSLPPPNDSSDRSTNPNTSKRSGLTRLELADRDRNAIASSKTLLCFQGGDTLVYITYPTNTESWDHTGFKLSRGVPFRIHSHRLLQTGSKKFAKLFEDWEQAKCKRRHKVFNGLPPGVKYVIDLTPPDEGDEAVGLTTELSCSTGIRHWFSAQRRCGVPADICGGKDHIIKPVEQRRTYEKYIDMADKPTEGENTGTNLVKDLGHYEIDVERDEHIVSALQDTLRDPKTFGNFDQQIQEALRRSAQNPYSNNHTPESSSVYKDSICSIDDVPEYCPVRHRAGIEILMQMIEGKEVQLDSAPKVWTLAVLAKYFECTNVVRDFIAQWVLQTSNCQFIEILPEATLRLGLILECATLVRPAFAILVSERALSTISRDMGTLVSDKAGTNQFGRHREEIDEDITNAIEEAAVSFGNRVQTSFTELVDAKMAWVDDLPELKKLARLLIWAGSESTFEAQKKLINEHAAVLEDKLSHWIRSQLFWAFHEFSDKENNQANDNRRIEAYLKPYSGDFSRDIYSKMAEKEIMMTQFPWRSLNDRLNFFTRSTEFDLLLEKDGMRFGVDPRYQTIARNYGLEPTSRMQITAAQGDLNSAILESIQNHGYNNGRLPSECFFNSSKAGVDDRGLHDAPQKKLRFEPLFHSALHARTAQDMQEHLDDSLGLFSPSGPFSNKYPNDAVFSMEEFEPEGPENMGFSEGSEKLMGSEDAASSAASTNGLYNFPLRPKYIGDKDRIPLSPKRPNPLTNEGSKPLDIPAAGTSGGVLGKPIVNLYSASKALLGSKDDTKDPRDAAIKLHNTPKPFSGQELGAFPARPGIAVPDIAQPARKFPQLTKTRPTIPRDILINEASPFFSLVQFFHEIKAEIHRICNNILRIPEELEFAVLTDTLLSLTDDEWKFLPLWAGGNEDGTGGVFAPMIPPAPPGAGPSGPGPAFHTGYSSASRASTDNDVDGVSTVGYSTVGDSIDTVAVENGYSDHIDRRRIMAEDDIRSEAFSDDTEDYAAKDLVNGNVPETPESYIGKGKGKAVIEDDDDFMVLTPSDPGTPKASSLVEEDDDYWQDSDEEAAFDYGDEPDDKLERDEAVPQTNFGSTCAVLKMALIGRSCLICEAQERLNL